MSKFICDGCGRICDEKEKGGTLEIQRGRNAYGGPAISLIYCTACWTKRQLEEMDDE